jgi:hypothetical protein
MDKSEAAVWRGRESGAGVGDEQDGEECRSLGGAV